MPAAGFGALLTLLIFKTELSLYAFVGIIMLIGLVKKNGIMMVDFAVAAQREQGKSPREAIYDACLVRFRPIMMTTMAALVGTLPIALGFGAGAESRRPLGLAVVGGLLVSQLLTLYITPVYYVYIEDARMWLARRRSVPVAARGTRGMPEIEESAGPRTCRPPTPRVVPRVHLGSLAVGSQPFFFRFTTRPFSPPVIPSWTPAPIRLSTIHTSSTQR